jgi:hypothetical protein
MAASSARAMREHEERFLVAEKARSLRMTPKKKADPSARFAEEREARGMQRLRAL